MKITFLGTGTSQGVPLIACSCDVCSSKDLKDKRLRSSLLIESEKSSVVIDSGPDFRQQMLRLNVKQLDAVVFTHEHKDHIAGLDDIKAFNFILKKKIDVYATERVQQALKREYAYIFSDDKYPGIPEINLHTLTDKKFEIGDIQLTPVEVIHFKLPILGFRIKDFTYITDAKYISDQEIDKIKGTEILVINALRREEHISHFTFDQAIDFAKKINAEKTYFTHISHQLGLHQEVEKELPSNIRLAFDGLTFKI